MSQPPSLSLDPEHNIVSAMVRWVEDGVAPSSVIGVKYNNDVPANGIAFTRPICKVRGLSALIFFGWVVNKCALSVSVDGALPGRRPEWREQLCLWVRYRARLVCRARECIYRLPARYIYSINLMGRVAQFGIEGDAMKVPAKSSELMYTPSHHPTA